MPSNVYWCFRHETWGSEDCSKNQSFKIQFWVKTTSHWHRSRDVDDVQRQSRFGWKKVANHGRMAWNQSTINPIKASRRAKTKKNLVKFGQIKWFSLLLSSIAMAWCIMNSIHKVVRSIKNTTLKLCADCAKQFVRDAQNSGKPNYGFCTIITHHLTRRCLCVPFWPKTKP